MVMFPDVASAARRCVGMAVSHALHDGPRNGTNESPRLRRRTRSYCPSNVLGTDADAAVRFARASVSSASIFARSLSFSALAVD